MSGIEFLILAISTWQPILKVRDRITTDSPTSNFSKVGACVINQNLEYDGHMACHGTWRHMADPLSVSRCATANGQFVVHFELSHISPEPCGSPLLLSRSNQVSRETFLWQTTASIILFITRMGSTHLMVAPLKPGWFFLFCPSQDQRWSREGWCWSLGRSSLNAPFPNLPVAHPFRSKEQ